MFSSTDMLIKIFADITKLFSKASVPLIHEVIPMLEAMEHDLERVVKAKDVPKVIRIAAMAGLQVVSKYYGLTDDSNVYCIAISLSLFMTIPFS